MNFKIDLPLRVHTGKTDASKYFIMNLNNYRNEHFMALSAAKRNMHQVVQDILKSMGWPNRKFLIGTKPPYRATWVLYKPTKTRMDLENPLPIISKFVMDALVAHGILEDDNDEIIAEVVYRPGGVDKFNPRAVLEITPLLKV